MKFGNLRNDDDGHEYVVPVELVEEFDIIMDYIRDLRWGSDKRYDAEAEFEAEFGKYRVGGEIRDMKIIMED